MSTPQERFKRAEDVAFFKAGAFGPPGGGKSMLAALLIIGAYRRWKCTKPVMLFDSDRGGKFLKPLFDHAGIELLIDDESLSLKALRDDLLYAEKEASFFMIDSIADPWSEVCSTYLKVSASGRNYIDIGDWPTIFRTWEKEFEIPFKAAKVHAIWTSKPKGLYDSVVDIEKSERSGKEVLKSMKVDEGATGGKQTEFGPGLTVECRFEIRQGKRQRVIEVMKDRFIQLNGKILEFKEPLTPGGEIDFAELIDNNPTFQAFLPHFARINPGASASQHSFDDDSSSVFFVAQRDRADNEFYARRNACCDEMQNLLTMRFPSTSGADKAAKLKLTNWLFGTTVWEHVQRVIPMNDIELGMYELKIIFADNDVLQNIVLWDGVSAPPAEQKLRLRDQAEELKMTTMTQSASRRPNEKSEFDRLIENSARRQLPVAGKAVLSDMQIQCLIDLAKQAGKSEKILYAWLKSRGISDLRNESPRRFEEIGKMIAAWLNTEFSKMQLAA